MDGHEAPLALLRQLIGAQGEGECAVQRCVAARLALSGCEVRELEYEPGELIREDEFASATDCYRGPRQIVLGRLWGSAELPSLLIFAHPDSEPMHHAEGWRREPLAGEVEDGRLYGWGVADDLAGCAAGLHVMEQLARSTSRRGELYFLSAPSKSHARGAAALLKTGLRFDAALYLHPAESGRGLGELKTATPGQLEFLVTIRGALPDTTEPAHTALSHRARNPVELALLVCERLRDWARRRAGRVRHARIEAIAGRATNLHIARLSCGVDTPLSRVAEHCTIGGAVSIPPGDTVGAAQQELERELQEASRSHPWLAEHPVSIEWISGAAPAEMSEDDPFVRLARHSIESVAGSVPRSNCMHVASDIRHPILRAGIPCVGLGCLCGDLSQNGATDEWIDVESYFDMIAVAVRIAQAWTSGAGAAAELRGKEAR